MIVILLTGLSTLHSINMGWCQSTGTKCWVDTGWAKMIRTRLFISILFLSLLSSPSHCRLLASTAGKIFSAPLVLHTREHTDDNNEVEVEDHGNRRCFKKVMMVEQLEYQDVETCNHSYDKVGPPFCVKHFQQFFLF